MSDKSIKSFISIIMVINMCLGTGPIIMPPVFLSGGVILSTIFIISIAFLSYIGCEYIMEAISISNALEILSPTQENKQNQDKLKNQVNETCKNQQEIKNDNKSKTSLNNLDSCVELDNKQEHKNYDQKQDFLAQKPAKIPEDLTTKIEKQSLSTLGTHDTLNLNSQNKLQKKQSQNNLSSDESLSNNKSNTKKYQNSQYQNSIYYITKNFEFQDLGKQILGNFGEKFSGILATLDTFGANVSYCIITGKTMSSVFENIEILNNYYFWLGIFFFLSSIFSFKDVSNIKFIQKFIGFIRFITIMLFLIIPVYLMFRDDKVYPLSNFTYDYEQDDGTIKQYEYTPFNTNQFSNLFSNLIFSFLFHPALGSIMSYTQPQKSIKKSMIISFVACLLISVIIPYLAIMCFGGELTDPYDNWNIVFYTEMFKGKIDVVYYFTSFYLFLNVATIPVLTIVLRKNLLALLNYKENEEKITAKSFIANLLILLSILLCSAIFKDKIQLVLSLIFGIFGSWIMIGIPSLLVIVGRRKIQKLLENKDNLPNDKNTNNIHQPLITNKYFTYLMLFISVVLFFYNTFLVINDILK